MSPEEIREKIGRREAAVIGLVAVLVAAPVAVETLLVDTAVSDYRTQVNVTEDTNSTNMYLGVNADDSLEFGVLPQGSNVTKQIVLETTSLGLVNVEATGNISDHLEYSPSFKMNGSRQYTITANAEETGYYAGQITIKIQSADGPIGRQWIRLKSYFY